MNLIRPIADPQDDLFEMVNLARKDTGVGGIIYISTAQGQHGPRVKWYPGRPGRDEPCLTVTLETQPRVLNHQLPPRIAAEAGREVTVWAERNRDALLHFWNDGLSWTRDEVNAFIDGLAKLP